MSADPIDLSIVIVNWNVREMLRECLASVRRETRCPADRHEVHVVDNASADGSIEMVRREFPDIRLTANEANVGFARAHNQILDRCRGRYILALNPDTVVIDGAIDRMLGWMDSHPDVGVLGCRKLNSDGSFQRAAGGAFPTLRNMTWNYLFLNKLLPRSWAPPALFMEEDLQGDLDIDWVSGAALLVRREALEGRFFDEAFFMFGEDWELCERVRRGGRRVVYTSRATVIHHHGGSMSKQDSQAVFDTALKGPRTFYAARNGRTRLRAYDLIVLAGYLIRWPLFGLMSLVDRGTNASQRSRDSRRHAWTALRLLLRSDGTGR